MAALAEPLAIRTNNVSERAKIFLQDFVVEIGLGPIGILTALAAKENDASQVVVLGVDRVVIVMKENAS